MEVEGLGCTSTSHIEREVEVEVGGLGSTSTSHVRGEVEVGGLWRGPSHQHRLADEQCRALGPGGRQGRGVGGQGGLVGSRGGRGARVVAPRGLTSLGLLDLTCGEVRVGGGKKRRRRE